MVNVVIPVERTSVHYNVDTDSTSTVGVPDSIRQLAEDKGIYGAANSINQESREYDHQLRESDNPDYEPNNQEQENDHEFESPQDNGEVQPKKKKRTGIDKQKKRIDDVTYKYMSTLQEKEELERQLKLARDQHAASMLAFEKQRLADQIDRVSEIMVEAKDNDETKTYVEANRVLHSLLTKETQATEALDLINESVEQGNTAAIPPEIEEQQENRYFQLSDTKELESEAYVDWLRENPFYNPYDLENYDDDLASDVHEIKRTFNKFLKSKRNGNYIGTPEYYQDLDIIVQQKLFSGFDNFAAPQQHQQPQHQQQRGYSDQGYNQQQETNDMRHVVHVNPEYERSLEQAPQGNRIHGQYAEDGTPAQQHRPQQQRQPNMAPVNRAGYNQHYQSNDLPNLTADQHRMALQIPMFDERGRSLSEAERIHKYREGLRDMSQRR